MDKKKTNLTCDVNNCRYNCIDNCCELDSIKVSFYTKDVTDKKGTICDSFECNCNKKDRENN